LYRIGSTIIKDQVMIVSESITQLLNDWQGDRTQAFDQLVEQVYTELSLKARQLMRGERDNHTLQTQSLVHETYIRLLELRRIEWQDRHHFFSVASALMRRILVDHARAHSAQRRKGDAICITLKNVSDDSPDIIDVLSLDQALRKLARKDLAQTRIVELRYFGGLTIEQTAKSLELSPATVKRKWTLTQAWLYRELCVTEL
jgi:RNA polymerase sigma factor (TIGR02999 family)